LKKTFLKTEIKRAIIEPETDLDDVCIVPGMNPKYIGSAVIDVSEDGYAFVSWLQPVIDWKYHTWGILNAFLFWILLYCVSVVVFGVAITLAAIKLEILGVI
jgi:hypothetical protein